MTEDKAQGGGRVGDVTIADRVRYGCQWAGFWWLIGLLAGATWSDALLYGAGIGFGLGWLMRVGIFRYLWWRITLRHLHLWKPFDWRRFF